MRNSLPIIAATCAIAAALASASPAQAQVGGCSAPVPLDLSGPRPVVMLTSAAGTQVKAVFDTGAMGTVVNAGQTEALGVTREGPLKPPFDHASHGDGYQGILHGVHLGDMALPDMSVPVLPPMLPDVAAILSPQMFAGKLVRLDLAAATLTICPLMYSHHLGAATPYVSGPFALPGISVTAGSQTILAHIDTGSPMELSFPMRFAKTLPLAGPLVVAGKARSHMGEMPVYKAQIKGRVQIGPLTLDDPEVRFSDVMPEPNVGGALLRRLVIIMDPAGQRSWATAK